jgi:putative DNA primase/helicase
VLVLSGPPGSGKTLLARILRSIVDPSNPSLLTPPTSERDLFNMALHNHILAFDNIKTQSTVSDFTAGPLRMCLQSSYR